MIPPRFYIHTFPGSLRTLTISNSSISDPLSSRFSSFRANGPRSLSRVKAGTHPALLKGSHTRAYTPKHGYFRWGWYHYPRSVSHGSETLRGQGVERQTLPLLGLGPVCSRRTQRACGTAMRLCASLSRRRRGPAGLRDLFTFVEVAACTPCAQSFLCVRSRGGITTLGVLRVLLKRRTAACQSGSFAIF